jgi:acyl-coenzyme A thioesterase PaaI-like protein
VSDVPAGFRPVPPRGGDFADTVGPLYMRQDGDDAILGLRLEARHCNGRGVAHGGMLVALVDDQMGYVVWDVLKRPSATASLTCDFVGPARLGNWVEVRATPTRIAIELIFMRGEVRAAGQLVLTASGVWKQFRGAAAS